MVYYYLFGVNVVNYYFQVSFNVCLNLCSPSGCRPRLKNVSASDDERALETKGFKSLMTLIFVSKWCP